MMKELLIETLEKLGYSVYLQGSMTEYPDSFITFFTTDSSEQGFFDGVPHGTAWTFTVIFYTNNPALMSTVPMEIYTALKSAGFIPQGKGMDIPSDEPTHTGWANDYIYLEN